jgi:epoxyqueuosine reductase
VRRRQPHPTFDELRELAGAHGIAHLGVAPAAVMERARRALHDRKAAGLDGGMQFTYRNPDRSTDPQRSVPGARSVIVGARSYLAEEDQPRPCGPEVGPHARVARYAWVDHYAALRSGLRDVAMRLRASGERAVVLADDNAIVDRDVAVQAGLGWFGKNANVLVPGAGSWFVLGCVVTTAAYPVARPVADGCGSCRRCLDGCPTGAIVAPAVVDANRCLAWLLQRSGTFPVEHRVALGDRFYGCDDCQEVCPPTVRLGHRETVKVAAAADAGDVQAWVDVLHVLEAGDDELIERYGRWYLAQRDPRWWRRNALVVIGNVGDPADRRVRAVVERYRSGPDALLAEHASWAAARLDERRALVSSGEPDAR